MTKLQDKISWFSRLHWWFLKLLGFREVGIDEYGSSIKEEMDKDG